MVKLTKGAWIVVADANKALLLRNLVEYPAPSFEVIAEHVPTVGAEDLKPSGQSGRRADGGPNQKTAVTEPHWQEDARDRFAAELAGLLYSRAHKGAFDDLVLVASPKVLGALRGLLHQEVTNRVVAEIPKDLTNHPVAKLEKLIKAEMDAM
ncbi:host attachment protein [Ruegeria sediminis]|uniref:Host attachment protein n=1 Tax=Ruegeria sediminis TaxID=2583820 RepID=A0ABY2WS94_9RHOB|nr:host attachment family protein [Ruegeria sediminis]TMV03288.1 host attachment protein [Ruegeria sediminis]